MSIHRQKSMQHFNRQNPHFAITVSIPLTQTWFIISLQKGAEANPFEAGKKLCQKYFTGNNIQRPQSGFNRRRKLLQNKTNTISTFGGQAVASTPKRMPEHDKFTILDESKLKRPKTGIPAIQAHVKALNSSRVPPSASH